MNPTADSQALSMLAQADCLLLIADLLDQPHRVADRSPALSQEERNQLLTQAGWNDRPDLVRALDLACEAAASTPASLRADAYTVLFDGAVACPADESMYVRRDKGAILADICGFYRAFGFKPAAVNHEKPDHVVTELQFVAVLLVMLGGAIRSGDEQAARITREALAAFTAEHPSEWLPLFAGRLRQVAVLPFYVATAELLDVVWQTLLQTRQLPQPEPAAINLDPEDPGTPYECDMAESGDAPVGVSIGGIPIPR